MMDFDEDFKKFLNDYYGEKFVFLARPNQYLKDHIANMLFESLDYFNEQPPFSEKFSKYIYCSTIIGILTHDIGKINPYFQYRIYRKNKLNLSPKDLSLFPSSKKNLSYHSVFGAIYSSSVWEIYFMKVKELTHKNKKGYQVSYDEYDQKVMEYLTFETIISHHSPKLITNFNTLLSKMDEDDNREYIEAIKKIKKKTLSNLVKEIIQTLKKIIKKRRFLRQKSGNNYFHEFITFILKEGFLEEVLIEGYYNLLQKFDGVVSHHLLEIGYKEKISHISTKASSIFDENGVLSREEIYLLVNYSASLICDLDIWDARFHEPGNFDHGLEFYDRRNNSITSFKPKIVENYVSEPFGKINKNYSSFIPSSSPKIINILRNQLFIESNKEKVNVNEIYSLNSPTGAGKTLTLLNLSQKTIKKYIKKWCYRPKILYALPFISIGTQVAEQIHKVYDENESEESNNHKKSDFISSPTLMVDNYTTEAIWNELEIEDEIEGQIIQGNDAKWLISTWRSNFIVTTFVKLFHSILKPSKRHYLHVHRIANSIIILDEVQCLPIEYWENIKLMIKALSKNLNCTFFLSTATQPAILENTEKKEIAQNHLKKKLLTEKADLHKEIDRYDIRYYLDKINIEDFTNELIEYCSKTPNEDILIVLNTKKAASHVYKGIEEKISDNELCGTSIQMLSTNVLPLDRKKAIQEIKEFIEAKNKKRKDANDQNNQFSEEVKRMIVVSTQVIEAGVDLSFPIVFRDLAPLDSIIQVAGRCNRSFDYQNKGIVYLMELIDLKGIPYFHKIYKKRGVYNITKKFLEAAGKINTSNNFIAADFISVSEPQIRSKFQHYFKSIKSKNYTKDLTSELKSLDYESLSFEFDLIKPYPDQVLLFLIKDHQAKRIHDQIEKFKRNITAKFYTYSITIDKKTINKLLNLGYVKKCYQKKRLLYFYLPNKYVNKLYSEKAGFDILNDFNSL